MRYALFVGVSLFMAISGGIAHAADVGQLAATLNAGSPSERIAAADALADIGGAGRPAVPQRGGGRARPAVRQLVAALPDSDPALRWRAARALGVIGDTQAADALRKAASDPE